MADVADLDELRRRRAMIGIGALLLGVGLGLLLFALTKKAEVPIGKN